MPPKSARAGAENWGKNWGKIPETRHKNGAASQQDCEKPVEKSAKWRFLIAASLSAPFGTKRSQVQILSPRPQIAGNRKVSGSFFIQFAQNAVFGAFFMQRRCNLGERTKDRGGCSSVSNRHCIKKPLPYPIGIMAVANS